MNQSRREGPSGRTEHRDIIPIERVNRAPADQSALPEHIPYRYKPAQT